jgi:trans-2,3-dihydro-3-hydroxyanthranilate isomerase
MSSPLIPRLTDWHGAAQVHPYFVCDVFTAQPLQGNQLGVFVDGRPFTTEQMQSLAREMNFSETVFLLPPREGGDVWIRIFAPESELPFAGHPVLGTAFVVGTALGKDKVALETGAGLIPVQLEHSDDRPIFGRMQLPIPECEPFERERDLLDALGLTDSALPVELYWGGAPHVFIALESEDEVAALKPDLAALKGLGIAANCFAGSGHSWKTRMFCPARGITEDAATGSAAGPLALHLARHGRIRFGQEIEIRQGAEIGRPSVLHAVATGSPERVESVEVGGAALIVARGDFRIDQSRAVRL